MPPDKTNPSLTAAHRRHAVFFRQSAWLMIAGIAGGALTWGVHFLAKAKNLTDADYGDFVALTMLMTVLPTMPLQMVFTQQTAAGLATGRERGAAGMIRATWIWSFVLWLGVALVVLAYQKQIVAHWHLESPARLWITMLAVLFAIWLPLFLGVLQGQQNFFWMGWASILGGICRLGVAALIVLALNGGGTGMVTGVMVGTGISAGIGIWFTRRLWTLPSSPFNWRSLLKQIVPLTLGFGACQFMFAADTLFAKAYFGGNQTDMACYGAAGTLSRALLWLVLPLAAVMFPKIVHSSARAEKSNLQGFVLLGTAALGISGAISLVILGPWVIRLPYPAHYVEPTMTLLPWYAGAMVPLGMANVLINNLLARGAFRVVPALVVVAVAYGLALTRFHETPLMLLQTLAGFNVLLLAVCAFFTWAVKPGAPKLPPVESTL